MAAVSKLPPAYDVEQGYAIRAGLFGDFLDGAIFWQQPPRPVDLDAMLARDGKARGLEQVLTLPLRQAPVTVEPQKGDTGGAALVQEALDGMTTPLSLILAQATSSVTYRNAYFEKVFELVDGKVMLRKLAFRPPQTCWPNLDKANGSFDGFNQRPQMWPGSGKNTFKPIAIPAEKALVFTHGQHLRPVIGMSDLEVAYWCFKAKEKIRFLWYQWLECASAPRTVIKDADQARGQGIASLVAKLRGGGVTTIPANVTLDTIPVEGTAQDSYQAAMAWLDQEASISVMAGFTDLAGKAASGAGSFALSRDQTDFFVMGREAVATEMGGTFTTYLAKPLVEWNLGADSVVPKVKVGPVAEVDITAAISLLETTIGAGDTTLPGDFIRGLVGPIARTLGMDVTAIVAAMKDAEDAAIAAAPKNANPAVTQVASQAAGVGAAAAALDPQQKIDKAMGLPY